MEPGTREIFTRYEGDQSNTGYFDQGCSSGYSGWKILFHISCKSYHRLSQDCSADVGVWSEACMFLNT